VEGYTNADIAQHIMRLKKLIPKDDFTVILQKPFVVIGMNLPKQSGIARFILSNGLLIN